MNSACAINSLNGGHFLATYNWDGDGFYVIGEYDAEGNWVDARECFVSDSHDKVDRTFEVALKDEAY